MEDAPCPCTEQRPLPSEGPPMVGRLKQRVTMCNRPAPVPSKTFCQFPFRWIPRIKRNYHTGVARSAKLSVIKGFTGADKFIAHLSHWNYVKLWVMESGFLQFCWLKAGRQ